MSHPTMSCVTNVSLVFLLLVSSGVGTGSKSLKDIFIHIMILVDIMHYFCTDDSTTECVSQQELAPVKVDMERKVDQLHAQLHYW